MFTLKKLKVSCLRIFFFFFKGTIWVLCTFRESLKEFGQLVKFKK